MTELTGRTALVTGGSRGIGAATARQLARLGAHVVLTYRNSRAEADEVAVECGGTEYGSAKVLHADLEGRGGVDALLAELAEVAPVIDIVVDNAGASIPRSSLLACPTQKFTEKISADVAILHRLIQGLVPSMHRRGFGRIVAITSGHALGPSAPGMAAHGVTKAAIEALVHYAATELGHDGVTINAIRPGFVSTAASSDVPEEIRQAMTRAIPAGRLATAQDIAGIVALIAQPASQWVNGVAIPAAGGLNYPTDWARVYPAAYV
jgi:NAD(P)-dependent dehydrogenase (short-subunit alcohol dehydrogenase family)